MIERLSPAFDTARLTVRLVEASDLDALMPINGDDDVTRFLPYVTWHTIEDAHAWYARIARLHDEGGLRQFVLIDRSADRPVGMAVVFRLDESNRRAELGYVLGRRDWGRGLMREALDGLLPRMFTDLELRRVEAFVDPRNAPSHRLLLALGFRHEGLLRGRSVMKGEVVDSNVYGLLTDELRRLDR